MADDEADEHGEDAADDAQQGDGRKARWNRSFVTTVIKKIGFCFSADDCRPHSSLIIPS